MSHSRFAPSVPWVLFLMFMVFFGIFPRLLLSPLLLRISGDLGIGFDRASRFFLSASAGFVTGLLSSGFVAQRLTHRRTIAFSVALGGLMMIVLSRVHSVAFFHIVLAIMGWANGLYPGSGVASVTTIVPDAHHGKALAIHESGPNLAFITAPILSALLAPSIGWRGVMVVTGIAALLAAISFARFGRADTDRGEPPHFENISVLAKNRSFWVVSVLFTVAATAAMGVFSVLPTYLIVDHGLEESFVNTLIGVSRVTAFAAILSAGSIADRFGFKIVVSVVMVITGTVTLLIGAASGAVLIVSVFLQPMIVGAFFPVGLSALTSVAAPRLRNLAVAMAIPLANLVGGGISPPLLSAAGAGGGFRTAFVVLGVLIIASVGTLPLMERSRGRF